MDSRELKKKLVDSRIRDADGLTLAERQILEQDRELQTEMQLNLVIDTNRPQAPQAPEVSGQIDGALKRVAVLQAGESKRPGRRLRWRLAVAAATVLVLMLLTTALPWRLTISSAGIGFELRDAWASFSGHLIECTLVTAEYFHGTVEDAPDHPVRMVEDRLADWASRHAALIQETGRPEIARLSVSRIEPDPATGLYQTLLQIGVFDADESLAAELAVELAEVAGLDKPRTVPQEWYTNRRYPGRYFAGRSVVIAGREYSYPAKLNEEAVPPLATMLKPLGEGRRLYVALDGHGEQSRYGLTGLVSVDHHPDGVVQIDPIAPDFDFATLGLPGWAHSFAMVVPSGDEGCVTDPAALIKNLAAAMGSGDYAACLADAGHRIVVDLQGDTGSGAVTDESQRRIDDAVGSVVTANAGTDPDLDSRLTTKTIAVGGEPVQWYVQTNHPGDEYLVRDLSQSLKSHDVQPLKTVPAPRQLAAVVGNQTAALAYYFFELDRFAGLHQSAVRREFSDSEFEYGLSLSQQIDTVLDTFKVAQGISLANPDALPGMRELVYNGLVTGVLVESGYSPGPEFEALKTELARIDGPVPVVVQGTAVAAGIPETIRQTPIQRLAGLTPVLTFHLSFEERCQVCLDTNLDAVFTDAEREASQAMLREIRGQVRQWLYQQEAGTGACVVETVAGGTVVRIMVQCNRTDDATVADLAGAINIADPPTSYYLERIPQA